MDQGVISTFKGYYLRRTFKLLLSETDGQDKPTMLEFWKKFSIMKAIKMISDSWEEVKPSCMNGVCRKIWPECVHRSAAEVDGTPAVRHEISNLARESNFEVCVVFFWNVTPTQSEIKDRTYYGTLCSLMEKMVFLSAQNDPTPAHILDCIGAKTYTRCFGSSSILPIKKMDQRTCIKFCVKNKIKCADAFRMLTVAYGEATLDRSNVYRWYKMFSEGREDVNDEERAGRPSTSTTDEKINEVEKMILANRRITVREVAEDLNISIGSCHSIFINDLGMRRVAAKFVPKLLNCDQKQHRMNIANEMLDSVRHDPNLLQRVKTGDEAWVYGYDVETKAQSSQWKLPHEPRPKKSAPNSVECESFADSFLRLQGRGAS
ncbi:hypothetical protein LAZ67_7002514 [Cordylochernes scorpioides]|uniref:Mos1 transposase HTH domain-containing protein n=1 Tax=Cordylochernes scorpioides TaxID=51811 RepID=A0ABY6KQ69_9ARAC|nr:hypothetical protein LAZ67_7002514 [Cordylochernes scorpioides]